MSLPTYHLDLNHPHFITDPYEELKRLREQMPVFYDPTWDKVFFTRHADISALLKDKRLGRAILHILSRDELGWPPPDPRQEEFRRYQDNVFMDWEPPTHTRLRSLVSKVFTPKRVESLRGKLEDTTHQLIDAVQADGVCDFVRDIAEPLPVAMIADLLGIPAADRQLLRPWSAAIVKLYELGYTDEQVDQANRAATEFMEYIGALAAERRIHPQDDLISGLAQVEEQGQVLSEDELRATCIFLLNAGHEATVNGSALGLRALLRNPAQMTLLKEAVAGGDASLLKTGVDEMLRYDTPLPMFERYVLEDMEINGARLERGMEVGLLYIAGNRDPLRFERADEFDLARRDNPLLTFGLGTHYCLGAPLARLEMQVLFQTLLQRLPNVHLAGEIEFAKGFVIRGLASLPIGF
ncbi:MAG: cytochrome P450 [Chloroflexi bacterium]|nr:cytochrome P450 [Chloroflexota bacterium]